MIDESCTRSSLYFCSYDFELFLDRFIYKYRQVDDHKDGLDPEIAASLA
jgi:hypothetical protein